MSELVGDHRLGPLVLRKFVGVATDAVINADLHRARRQQLLKAVQPDVARGEAVIGDERRSFGVGHPEIGVLQRLAVERTEIPLHRRRCPLARAETILAADVDRKLWSQLSLVLPQKANQPAEVIVVTVAQHKCIEGTRLNTEEIDVVDQRIRREAKVNKDISCLGAAPGLNMHRKAELADQRWAGRLV